MVQVKGQGQCEGGANLPNLSISKTIQLNSLHDVLITPALDVIIVDTFLLKLCHADLKSPSVSYFTSFLA